MSRNERENLGSITAKDFMVIDIPDVGARPIAEAFIVKRKFVFADIGWFDPTGHPGHPFHVVPGKVKQTGENTWEIGDSTIRPADEINDDILGISRWIHYINNDEKAKIFATREKCLDNIKAEGLV